MEIANNKKILTDKELDFDNLTLFGLKLGDSIHKLTSDPDESNPYSSSLWISPQSNISYRVDSETKSTIVEFLMREDFLKDLMIDSSMQILQKFGNPLAIEKKNGIHFYFYPERKMIVAWWAEYNKLFGIYIGENMIKQTVVTAYDFLNKYFEFKGMVPNCKEWNPTSLAYNEPRYYRFMELLSLLKAFGIGTDLLQDFTNRGFLKNRKPEELEPIYADIEKYANETRHEKKRYKSERVSIRELGIEMIFQEFMRFIEVIRSTLRFNSGWLEAGFISSRYIINKTEKLLKTFDVEKLKEMENLICKVIAPFEKSFTIGELINKYEYPDVDLQAIDFENL